MLREYQESTGNGKQKDSVRKVIVVVSGTMRTSVQNRHQCPLLPLNHRQKNMVKKQFERKESWRPQSLRKVSSTTVQRVHQR